jgi:NAD(P)-dependent dehydrogenase (short-subunit alcohol dehydrogenase family)
MKIEGVSAIVTGGASGLGAATARLLNNLGAKVAIFDVNRSQGEAVALEMAGHFYCVDVTSQDSVIEALDNVNRDCGAARILVNCAGIGPPAKAVDREGRAQDLALFKKIIDINLVGTFNVASKFAANAMKLDPMGEERGVIINTASVAAFEGQIGQAAYAASKGGIVALTLPLAREFARSAIRVVTIAPGLFLTPLLASLPEAAQRSLGQQVPFPNRLGTPEEFAQLVQSVIANPMLNGETVRLDGAIRMAAK